MTKFNVPEKSPIHDFVQTFASLLVEILLENAYPLGVEVTQFHTMLVQATLDDVNNHVKSGARIWPTEQDAKNIGEVGGGMRCVEARRRWPNITRCIESGMEGSFALQRQKIPTLRDAMFTVHQLEQAVRERSMAEHPPHWKVMFQRGLVRIESHHPCGTVLIRDGADLMETSRLMLETIDSLRTAGVLP